MAGSVRPTPEGWTCRAALEVRPRTGEVSPDPSACYHHCAANGDGNGPREAFSVLPQAKEPMRGDVSGLRKASPVPRRSLIEYYSDD